MNYRNHHKRKRVHKAHTYSFTINTDASHYGNGEPVVSAWACWIRSSHFLIKEAGMLPDGLPNSSVAELLAVEQALILLDQLISTQEFLQYHKEQGKILLYINTDSKWVIWALKGELKSKNYKDIINRVRAKAIEYRLEIRHVKSHTANPAARSWVNSWCDTQARALAKARVEEIHGRPTTN